MLQNVEIMMQFYNAQFWGQQLPVARQFPVVSPGAAPANQALIPTQNVIFSTPQFFAALIAGVLMAFAFQFLLTNLSVAANISFEENSLETDSESLGNQVRKIGVKVGVLTLIIVTTALFLACFLAIKMTLISSGNFGRISLTTSMSLGAIMGVIIWSAYFLLLLWLSSTAIGSLVGSVANTASSGLQGVMATAGAALAGRAANAQIVNTVEASVAAVQKELSSALEPSRVREKVQDYLQDLPVPKLDLPEIRNNFEKLLRDSDIQSLTGSDVFKNVNRQTFVDLISRRTDFSKQDINRIADQLENAWQQVVNQQQPNPQTQLLSFLQQATPEELKSDKLGDQLRQILSGQNNDQENANSGNQVMQLGINSLLGAVLARTDLSDLDVEKITSQLQKLKPSNDDKQPTSGFNPIKADVENYLLNSQPWHLNRESLKQEFKDVIYDADAAPGTVRQQLEQLNQDFFVEILNRRGHFNSERVQEIANQLEDLRIEVYNSVRDAESQERSQELRNRVENYLRSTGKEELNPEGIERDFKTLLEDPDSGFDALKQRLSQFDRDTLVQLLQQRQDFNEEEANQLVNQLESTRESVLSAAQELQDQGKAQAEDLRHRVEAYLRDTNKEELNPEGIKGDLQTLLDDPQAGVAALQTRLSQFDGDTLVQLLNQRGDLSEEQINQVIDQFFSVRDRIVQAPRQLAGQAKDQYERVTNQIADYLRNTNLEELNPEGIQQDLAKLIDDPKAGGLALRERLSQVDRETLVKLLSQREDLSEEQVNQAIDQVQEGIRKVIRAPRRLASRATGTVKDFQSQFSDYLRNTNKEELNPEGIQQDLKSFFQDPQTGWQDVKERLSKFDRSTLVALLAQREDISEEEANRTVNNIESAILQFVEKAKAAQQQLKSVTDSLFGKIRNYLNSLELPELNYEGIKRDFRTLFDDPEAGFEALGERLSQFDRETLVALLSSREDISEADANRLIDNIEGVRDGVLSRTQRLQQEAQKRVQDLKHKAKQQLEETRKATAIAAWWLFGTALTSGAAAAIAGILAARSVIRV
jgi:nucleoid DNA-binding protein/DNA-binding transcriptional regulator YhcF (GntR family)